MDKDIDIERAWKDEDYRNSLTPEQLAQLPPKPAGVLELDEDALENVNGGIVPKAQGPLSGIHIKTE